MTLPGISHIRGRALFGALLFVAAGAPTPGRAIECGDTIASAEVLSHDLSCTGLGPGAALTVLGPSGSLDLGGHQLDCGGSAIDGISLRGTGATLVNGRVTDCLRGVDVAGDGGHVVRDVVAYAHAYFGFQVREESHDNYLRHNVARGSSADGFIVSGDRNMLVENLSIGNHAHISSGLANLGNDNRIIKNSFVSNGFAGLVAFTGRRGNVYLENVAVGNAAAGFEFNDESLTAYGNRAFGNQYSGFLIAGDDGTFSAGMSHWNGRHGIEVAAGALFNTLSLNRARGNSLTDMSDAHLGCLSNQWRDNRFQTAEAGGEPNPQLPGCID